MSDKKKMTNKCNHRAPIKCPHKWTGGRLETTRPTTLVRGGSRNLEKGAGWRRSGRRSGDLAACGVQAEAAEPFEKWGQAEEGAWGTEVPQWGPGAKSPRS